jgi:hypothetical protein
LINVGAKSASNQIEFMKQYGSAAPVLTDMSEILEEEGGLLEEVLDMMMMMFTYNYNMKKGFIILSICPT